MHKRTHTSTNTTHKTGHATHARQPHRRTCTHLHALARWALPPGVAGVLWAGWKGVTVALNFESGGVRGEGREVLGRCFELAHALPLRKRRPLRAARDERSGQVEVVAARLVWFGCQCMLWMVRSRASGRRISRRFGRYVDHANKPRTQDQRRRCQRQRKRRYQTNERTNERVKFTATPQTQHTNRD